MSKIFNSLPFLVIIVITLLENSCQKDELPDKYFYKGQVKFGLTVSGNEIKQKNTICGDSINKISSAIISIEDENGSLVYDFKEIEFYNFEGYLISQSLSLYAGSYKLVKFLLLDAGNNVIYAAPLNGSEKATLVNNPLPIDFDIVKDNITKVVPEVISTKNCMPEDFGYLTFSFEIVKVLSFQICVMIYNEFTMNFELTDAELLITANDEALFNYKLKPVNNNITIKDKYNEYKIDVSKSGYLTYSEIFSNDSLKSYCNNPLVVILEESNDLLDGLVAFYPFDGNADDVSGNNNHGTIIGALSDYDRFGKINRAYYFDGIDDYATFNDSAFDFSNQFSLSFWLRTSSTGFDERWFFKNFDPPQRSWFLSLNRVTEGKFTFFSSNDGINYHEFTSDSIFNDNKWNHVVLIYDGNHKIARFYKNSGLAGEDKEAFTKLNLNNIIFSISNTNYFNNWAHGYLDDLRIYNRILSKSEIYSLYKAE